MSQKLTLAQILIVATIAGSMTRGRFFAFTRSVETLARSETLSFRRRACRPDLAVLKGGTLLWKHPSAVRVVVLPTAETRTCPGHDQVCLLQRS